MPQESVRTGVVVCYHPTRAFGFLSEDGTHIEYFFHLNQVEGRITMQPGNRVEFLPGDPAVAGKAPKAAKVRLIKSTPLKKVE